MKNCNDFIEQFYQEATGKKVSILPGYETEEVFNFSNDDMEAICPSIGAPLVDVIASIFIRSDGLKEARELFNMFRWPQDNSEQSDSIFRYKLQGDQFLKLFYLTNPLASCCAVNSEDASNLAVEMISHRTKKNDKLPPDLELTLALAIHKKIPSIENAIRKLYEI